MLAALPIMTTCGEHGRRLEPEISVRLAAFDHDLVPSPPVPAPVSAMDRLSHEGLTTGMVTLPRRAVHVGVWLRLLRTLLDEVSMAASRVSPRSAATLTAVWDATGRPARAGLSIWRPHERLGSPHQQAMLEAAPTAVALAEAGEGHRPRDTRPAPDTRASPRRPRRRSPGVGMEAGRSRDRRDDRPGPHRSCSATRPSTSPTGPPAACCSCSASTCHGPPS